MLRRSLLGSALFLPAAALLEADMAGGNRRLSKLFATFIAPCCWRENLMVHHSPKADELRAEIRGYLARGWSDEQIRSKLVETYTKRILAMPEGVQGQWLVSMPWAVALTGAAFVCWLIHRSVRARPSAAGPITALPDFEHELE